MDENTKQELERADDLILEARTILESADVEDPDSAGAAINCLEEALDYIDGLLDG